MSSVIWVLIQENHLSFTINQSAQALNVTAVKFRSLGGSSEGAFNGKLSALEFDLLFYPRASVMTMVQG